MHAVLPPLAAIAALAALAGAPGPAPETETVEMEVAGVFPLEDAHAGVLVLRTIGDGALLLPIVVGRAEADEIARRLRREAPVRPRTQELLQQAIDALGGRVVRVEIRDASAAALYEARVFLAQGAQRIELDARPSDSVALAIGAGAPIFATRALVESSGLRRDELDRLRRARPGAVPEESPTVVLDRRM